MGLYRTLFADLPCTACGVSRQAQVQFRTGQDNLEEYKAGDSVAAEDLPFQQGRKYEASADRYCQNCANTRKAAEITAFFSTLAEFVEGGRLKLVKGLMFKTGLSPEKLRQMGTLQEKNFLQKPAQTGTLFSRIEGFDIVWDNEPMKPGTPIQSNFITNVNDRIALQLQEAGWLAASGLLREDLLVYLDTENRIQVFYQEAAPVS